jgi:hypothetical protein
MGRRASARDRGSDALAGTVGTMPDTVGNALTLKELMPSREKVAFGSRKKERAAVTWRGCVAADSDPANHSKGQILEVPERALRSWSTNGPAVPKSRS